MKYFSTYSLSNYVLRVNKAIVSPACGRTPLLLSPFAASASSLFSSYSAYGTGVAGARMLTSAAAASGRSLPPPPPPYSIWRSFLAFLKYRMGRLYYSFYYAQYNNKYVMVLLFPAILFAARFSADTRLAYRIYLSDAAADAAETVSSTQSSATVHQGEIHLQHLPEPQKQSLLQLSSSWANGTKVYMDDDATVLQLKKQLFLKKGEETLPDGILAACHGRVLEDSDSLAFAVRAFCKRDPKIFIWKAYA